MGRSSRWVLVIAALVLMALGAGVLVFRTADDEVAERPLASSQAPNLAAPEQVTPSQDTRSQDTPDQAPSAAPRQATAPRAGSGSDGAPSAPVASDPDTTATGGLAEAGAEGLPAADPSPYVFTATRADGALQLRGFVPDDAARAAIIEAARRSYLTDRIDDQLAIAAGAPPGFRDGALVAVEALSRLATGEASLSDMTLALQGEALYAQTGDRVGERLKAGLPRSWASTVSLKLPDSPDRNADAACQRDLAAKLEGRSVQFEAARAEIEASSLPILDEIAGVIRACERVPIEIGGHTDSDGSAAANRALSQERAQAVLDALVERGVSARRLSAVGFGQARPRAPNDTAENKALNRRIELSVVTGASQTASGSR
jgi:OOP family OmpA-OmpF porin